MRIIILAIVGCAFLTSCARQKEDRKLNVLLIFVDDMGFGDLSCYEA